MKTLKRQLRIAPATKTLAVTLFLVVGVWGPSWLWHADHMSSELRSARARIRQMNAEKAALLSAVAELGQAEPFLTGVVASSGVPWILDNTSVEVLYVMASDCPYSPQNLPEMDRLRDAGIEVVGIMFDDNADRAMTFVEAHGIGFPVVLEPEGPLRGLLANAGTPYTLVVSQGRLAAEILGPIPSAEVDRLVESYQSFASVLREES